MILIPIFSIFIWSFQWKTKSFPKWHFGWTHAEWSFGAQHAEGPPHRQFCRPLCASESIQWVICLPPSIGTKPHFLVEWFTSGICLKKYAFTRIFWLFFTTNFFFKNAFAFPEPVKSSKWTQIFHCQISIIISAKFHCWLKRKFNLLKRFSARNNPNAFWCVTTRHYKILWQKKNNPIAAQARKRAFLSPKKWREPISRLKAIFWFFPYWMCSWLWFWRSFTPFQPLQLQSWGCENAIGWRECCWVCPLFFIHLFFRSTQISPPTQVRGVCPQLHCAQMDEWGMNTSPLPPLTT